MKRKKVKFQSLKDFKKIRSLLEKKNIKFVPKNLVQNTKSKISNFVEDYKKKKRKREN